MEGEKEPPRQRAERRVAQEREGYMQSPQDRKSSACPKDRRAAWLEPSEQGGGQERRLGKPPARRV